MTRAGRYLSAALLPAPWAGAVGACQICVPLPERRLANRLLASAAVVLAHEDAARPFHYQPVETELRGPVANAYRLMLERQLAMASAMAHDLIAWRRWDFAALAHVEGGAVGGFLSGFSHPFSGLDHVLAMVAVGLWGAQLGAPAIWLLPLTFPIMMAFGGLLGLSGDELPWSWASPCRR